MTSSTVLLPLGHLLGSLYLDVDVLIVFGQLFAQLAPDRDGIGSNPSILLHFTSCQDKNKQNETEKLVQEQLTAAVYLRTDALLALLSHVDLGK